MFTQQPLLSTMGKLKRTPVQAFNMVYCDWTSVQAVNCSKQTRLEMQEGAKDDVESRVTYQTSLPKKIKDKRLSDDYNVQVRIRGKNHSACDLISATASSQYVQCMYFFNKVRQGQFKAEGSVTLQFFALAVL